VIGEWHNWLELEAIARESVQHSGPCNLLQELTSRTHKKAQEALAAATHVRAKYFNAASRRGNRRRGADSTAKRVLNATAKLAA
jgi:hypothetical protein